MTRHATQDERREQIREAALRLFARRGYAATRMDDIAREASLSKGAVYWHFASKKALFIELIEAWFARSAAVFGEALGAATGGPRERVMAGLRATAADFARRRAQMPILLEFWAEVPRDPELRALYVRIYGTMRATWAAIAGGDGGPGSGPGANARGAALVGAVSGIFVQWLADPDGVSLEDALDAVFELADLCARGA